MGIGTDYVALIAEKDKEIAELKTSLNLRAVVDVAAYANVAVINLQEQLRDSNEQLVAIQARISQLLSPIERAITHLNHLSIFRSYP